MANVIILTGGIEQTEDTPQIRRALGAYRVASSIKSIGYTAEVIDYIQYMTAEEIINAISSRLGDDTLWVGFSSTFFYSSANPSNRALTPIEIMYQNMSQDIIYKVYDYVNTNSKAKIVYGGAYALFRPADPRVDYYLSGYADVTVQKLTQWLDGKGEEPKFNTIESHGVTCVQLKDSEYDSPSMNNLHTDWSNLIPGEAIPIEFARGCIFKCKFCAYPLIGKRKGTYIRDMYEVKDELVELWEKYGTDTYYITDDTFNDDNDKMEDFHKMFTSLPFKPKFSAFLRLDLIDRFPHQADLLLESGLVGNFFGIETFNLKSGRAIGKGLHPDKVKKRLAWVADKWKNKVNIGVGLIVGLPYDDEEYFKQLYDYLHSDEYPASYTTINPLHIFDQRRGVGLYGSEFSNNPEIYGYKFDDNGRWYHEEQKIDFYRCADVAKFLGNSLMHKQKVSDFMVAMYLGMGVKLEDILTKTEDELLRSYDFPKMNREKLTHYKKMIGAVK